jgi:hypothetical protein
MSLGRFVQICFSFVFLLLIVRSVVSPAAVDGVLRQISISCSGYGYDMDMGIGWDREWIWEIWDMGWSWFRVDESGGQARPKVYTGFFF